MSMIKEVAFVAIAVSDAEEARKFYQETLELKPGMTAMNGAWVEYRSRRHNYWRRLSPRLAAVARRNDRRLRSRGFRCNSDKAEGARRDLRYG